MSTAYRAVLIALALAVPLAAQTAPEDAATAIIEGSVINIQNSRTIPRATVTLFGLKGVGSKSQRCDSSGHFIFQNVEPGSYRLMAQRVGFFSDGSKREYQPMIEVTAGEHVKNMPVWLMPAAVLSGEVLDEYNDPVPDVEIQLLAVQMKLGQMELKVAGKAITDDRGEYRVAGLHPGKYYVVAEYKSNNAAFEALKATIAEKLLERRPVNSAPQKEGLEALHIDTPEEQAYTYAPLFYPATSDFQQAQSLKLNPGDELAANFLMVSAPVVSIRGKVINGLTGGPPAGVSVAAFWTMYMQGEGMPAQVSGEDGTFEIRGVAPGTYTVRANFTQDKQDFEGEQTVEVGNEGAQNVQIAALPDFSAAGHVTIAGTPDHPPRRVLIEFAGEGRTPHVRASASFPEFKFEAQLRPDHHYYARALNLPEDYYLKSVAIGGHEMPPDDVLVSGVRGDMELTFSAAGAQIEGALYDSKGDPTRGSILLVPDVPQPGPPDLYRKTSAGSDGKFNFRGVPPGSYRLLAMESLALNDQVTDPDFARKIAGRGDLISVVESGKYIVALRLAVDGR